LQHDMTFSVMQTKTYGAATFDSVLTLISIETANWSAIDSSLA